MTTEYVELIKVEHSLLLATLISRGLEPSYFEKATGWDSSVGRHSYENGVHYIGSEDRIGLEGIIGDNVRHAADFWSDYAQRCAGWSSRLLATARSLAGQGEQALGPQELEEGFAAFAEATKAMAPFLAATPGVVASLGSLLTDRIVAEMGGPDAARRAGEAIRLIVSQPEPEAVREIRSCYRIALEMGRNDSVLEILRNKMANSALRQIESEYPQLHDLIRRHVDEFGWIRARGYRFEPLVPRELVQRIQMVVLRWNQEIIGRAAESKPPPALEETLGFVPSESLASLIQALSDLSAGRCLGIDVHLRAECIAQPFFGGVAEALGCTPTQLRFSSAEELAAALHVHSDGRRVELPLPDIDLRISNGFMVERSEQDLTVWARDTPAAGRGIEAAPLTGQAVSLGRAVGRVKIVSGPVEVLTLGVGDVLVAEASTPDKMGIESAFPSRTDAPMGMDKVAAIVTDEGGLLSHAATISRELGIPCIVGTERATQELADGQVVEVDATKGLGRVIVLDTARAG
jgi:phosphohistidine swiveling domain-containing protein